MCLSGLSKVADVYLYIFGHLSEFSSCPCVAQDLFWKHEIKQNVEQWPSEIKLLNKFYQLQKLRIGFSSFVTFCIVVLKVLVSFNPYHLERIWCNPDKFSHWSCVAMIVFKLCMHAVVFSNLKSQHENLKVLQYFFISKVFDFSFWCVKMNYSILLKYTNIDINASSKLKTLCFEFSLGIFLLAENKIFCVFKLCNHTSMQ